MRPQLLGALQDAIDQLDGREFLATERQGELGGRAPEYTIRHACSFVSVILQLIQSMSLGCGLLQVERALEGRRIPWKPSVPW